MKIADFVDWELDMYRKECNFTEDERVLFDLRSKNISLTKAMFEMQKLNKYYSESGINRLSKSVNKKVLKIPPRIVSQYRDKS